MQYVNMGPIRVRAIATFMWRLFSSITNLFSMEHVLYYLLNSTNIHRRLGNDRLSDGLNFQNQVIEPDGQEGLVIDSTPSDEANFISGMKPEEPANSHEDDDEEEEFLNEEYLKDLELSMTEEEKIVSVK